MSYKPINLLQKTKCEKVPVPVILVSFAIILSHNPLSTYPFLKISTYPAGFVGNFLSAFENGIRETHTFRCCVLFETLKEINMKAK